MDLLESRMSLRIIWNVLLHFGGLGLAWYLYGQGQLIPAFWLLAAILLLDMLWLLLDTWQAQRLLGWQARFDLDRMCADSWRWQQQNPNGFNT